MKMNYPRRNDKKFNKLQIGISILVIFIVALLLFSSRTNHFLASAVHYVGYPFWQFRTFVSDRSFFLSAILKSRLDLAEESSVLKRELEEANLKLKDREILEEEIKNLKSLFVRGDVSKVLPARILARPPQTSYDFFIVDAGKNTGLQGGEKVFFESVILGEVVEVFSKTSKIKLFSANEVETHAFIERSDLPVTVYGRGGGNFEANLPQEADVEEGDFLTVVGVGGVNRFLGQVEEIESTPTNSLKKILLRYPVNFSTIRWVGIETLGDEEL